MFSRRTALAGDTVHHPLFARFHVRLSDAAERPVRESRSTGRSCRRGSPGGWRVIEIGAGHGPNFAHYPSAVSGVAAIEPERTPLAPAAGPYRRLRATGHGPPATASPSVPGTARRPLAGV